MARKIDALYQRYYTGRPYYSSGTTQFHAMCRQYIPPSSDILEIGPGPPNPTSEFLARLGRVTGADVSDELMENRALSEARVYDGETLPFGSNTFEACVSNYVVEHVRDGLSHLSEVARVLKAGGVYVFRTPNRFHYVAIIAQMLPHAAHVAVANRVRSLNENAHDPWPTVYSCNSRRALRRHAASGGLVIEQCRMIEPEPSYGRASPALFYPMMLWERVLNSSRALEGLRANMLVVLRKPA
jgi:SAM-dependent methyltransferase